MLRERRKLFHLVVRQTVFGFAQYAIAQGRNKNMWGKISSDLYGDCTLIAGNMTLKWGDCTGLAGDFTGLPPGNVRNMTPKIFVQKSDLTPEKYGSGEPN